jgi:hypothetical protein
MPRAQPAAPLPAAATVSQSRPFPSRARRRRHPARWSRGFGGGRQRGERGVGDARRRHGSGERGGCVVRSEGEAPAGHGTTAEAGGGQASGGVVLRAGTSSRGRRRVHDGAGLTHALAHAVDAVRGLRPSAKSRDAMVCCSRYSRGWLYDYDLVSECVGFVSCFGSTAMSSSRSLKE